VSVKKTCPRLQHKKGRRRGPGRAEAERHCPEKETTLGDFIKARTEKENKTTQGTGKNSLHRKISSVSLARNERRRKKEKIAQWRIHGQKETAPAQGKGRRVSK